MYDQNSCFTSSPSEKVILGLVTELKTFSSNCPEWKSQQIHICSIRI